MFIGYYNYTVVLTYLGLSSAVVGMVEAMKHDYKTALICLLICGVCDMFDGMIARTSKKRSEDAKSFGVQIDSLCDVICFGVFPVVIESISIRRMKKLRVSVLRLQPAKWNTRNY